MNANSRAGKRLRASWSPVTVTLFCAWCHTSMGEVTLGQIQSTGHGALRCPTCGRPNTLPSELVARAQNGRPEYDPDSPPGRAEAWESIVGNGPLKRAMEVAIAGYHTVVYVGPPEFAYTEVQAVMGEWASIIQRCPCGEFMRYSGARCTCKMDEIDSYRKSRRFQAALDSDLIVEGLPPVESESFPEPYANVLARIERVRLAQAFGAKAGFEPKPEWVTYRHIGDAPSFKLLSDAKKRWELTPVRLLSVQRVAHTIAVLEGCSRVESRHMAEALAFRAPLQDP